MKKTFLDVMIQGAVENGDEVRFLALHDQGGRYINLEEECEIVVERVPEVETLLKTHYPEDLFYAFYSNQFEENERELNVFCLVEGQDCLINFDVEELENGKLMMTCFLYLDGIYDERLEEIIWRQIEKVYPEFVNLLLTYIKEIPVYRLHFATKDVDIVFR